MTFRDRFRNSAAATRLLAAVIIVALGVLSHRRYLIYKRPKYRAEFSACAQWMSEFEKRRADGVLASEENSSK